MSPYETGPTISPSGYDPPWWLGPWGAAMLMVVAVVIPTAIVLIFHDAPDPDGLPRYLRCDAEIAFARMGTLFGVSMERVPEWDHYCTTVRP